MKNLNLKPLFQSDSGEDRAKTIDGNLALIGGCVYCTENMLLADYVEQLEQATAIADEDTRKKFLAVVRSLKYFRERMIEASEGIAAVRSQIKAASAIVVE